MCFCVQVCSRRAMESSETSCMTPSTTPPSGKIASSPSGLMAASPCGWPRSNKIKKQVSTCVYMYPSICVPVSLPAWQLHSHKRVYIRVFVSQLLRHSFGWEWKGWWGRRCGDTTSRTTSFHRKGWPLPCDDPFSETRSYTFSQGSSHTSVTWNSICIDSRAETRPVATEIKWFNCWFCRFQDLGCKKIIKILSRFLGSKIWTSLKLSNHHLLVKQSIWRHESMTCYHRSRRTWKFGSVYKLVLNRFECVS